MSTAVDDLFIRRHLVVNGQMGVVMSNTRNTGIRERHRKEQTRDRSRIIEWEKVGKRRTRTMFDIIKISLLC